MATYIIKINERTKEGKGLLDYLRALGVITEKEGEKEKSPYSDAFIKKVQNAERDIKEGRFVAFRNFSQTKKYLESL